MRFHSSPSSSLQFLAAATTDVTMSSSRASYRGRNQWRRGFSDRPTGNRNEFVSGDSHFRSVGDTNYGFRHVEGGQFPNSDRFQQPFRHPPPQFRHPHLQFHQPPPQFRQTTPQFHQPPHFRPFRPSNYKPPDYRNWEYALSQPPSHCERFVVLSYNILADYLAINHRRELYFHIPRHILDWEWRKRKIVFELGLWSPDIMCLQEVDRFQDLEQELKLYGYSGIWKMRTGIPVDGCAIFWRTTRFKFLHEESIEFNKLGLRDNVAQICVLELKNQNCADIGSAALPQSSNGANQVVICNTHVLYNPRRGEIKLGQVRALLDRAHTVSKLWNDAPVVICGDFNCTPKSPLYNFISKQKLDLTGLARDKISGQSSAQTYTPRPYTPNPGHVSFRARTPDNLVQASILGDEKEVGVKRSNDIPVIHNHNKPNSNVESVPVANNLHQPQSTTGVPDISHKLCFDVHYGEGISKMSDESSKETQQEIIDGCRDEISSSCYVPVEVLLVDPGNDAVQDLNQPLTSCENSSSVVVENGNGDRSSGSSDCSIHGTSFKHSQFELHTSSLMVATMQDELVHDDMEKGTQGVEGSITSESNVYHTESRLDEKPENAFIQDTTPYLVPDTSFADDNKVSPPESLESLSPELIACEEKGNPSTSDQSAYKVNVLDASTCVNLDEDQKLGEVTQEDGSSGQDHRSTFSSEVYITEDVIEFDVDHNNKSPESDESDQYLEKCATTLQKLELLPPCDEVQGGTSLSVDSEPADMEKYTYDPSSWTPMEIETASGSAECTLLEHPLKLRSTYVDVEDYSGTRDSSKEPQVTSYHRRFMGTVDYIWCSEGLQTVKVLDTIPKHALQWTPGFPTPKWGSDHIALASQLAFTKDRDRC